MARPWAADAPDPGRRSARPCWNVDGRSRAGLPDRQDSGTGPGLREVTASATLRRSSRPGGQAKPGPAPICRFTFTFPLFTKEPGENCMTLKLTVGISKKVGQPNYGSLGAQCQLEYDLDVTLLVQDLEQFHQRVRQAYQACTQAVEDELARHRRGLAVTEPVSGPQAAASSSAPSLPAEPRTRSPTAPAVPATAPDPTGAARALTRTGAHGGGNGGHGAAAASRGGPPGSHLSPGPGPDATGGAWRPRPAAPAGEVLRGRDVRPAVGGGSQSTDPLAAVPAAAGGRCAVTRHAARRRFSAGSRAPRLAQPGRPRRPWKPAAKPSAADGPRRNRAGRSASTGKAMFLGSRLTSRTVRDAAVVRFSHGRPAVGGRSYQEGFDHDRKHSEDRSELGGSCLPGSFSAVAAGGPQAGPLRLPPLAAGASPRADGRSRRQRVCGVRAPAGPRPGAARLSHAAGPVRHQTGPGRPPGRRLRSTSAT